MTGPHGGAPDAAAPQVSEPLTAVVAIGASAGGLAACSALLRGLPSDTGAAFVLVQHLDPRHDSLLVELLAKATTMPVVQATDGMLMAPNRLHVLPPDAALAVHGGTLRVLPRDNARPPMPIDHCLRTLADQHGSHAIAVILSGTGSDGSLGAQSIREHGGVVLAQEPSDAEFAAMPSNALATGCVDASFSAAQLGPEIARLVGELARPPGDSEIAGFGAEGALREVLELLRVAVGIDFSRYRRTTVNRRLQRRIALRAVADIAGYLAYVRVNPGELQELASDLLIAVTRFFRDPEVFEFLGAVAFPDLIRRARGDGVVRIWIPGCSTGEEAYSLAMTFVETAQRLHSSVACQVFATDINEAVLEKARRAVYPQSIAADVSAGRLARFFTPASGEYRLNREIRDLCIFSRHDLLRDPPLSRMAMISCRNLLIYLESASRPALELFHFALVARGYLLLGRSETAALAPELFETVDKDVRLFRSLESVAGHTGPIRRDLRPRLRPPTPGEPPSDAVAYEELVAANEELQSLNEELESSKEEIESINEELITVNDELRSRNAALHVAKEFSLATLDTVRNGLVVLSPAHTVVNANRSFYRMFQLSPADVEGRSLAAVAPDYFASPGITGLLEKAQAGEVGPHDVELSFDPPGAARRVLAVNVRRFVPGDLLLFTVDDVTKLRELEADRRLAHKMEAIGHLAAGVAHDFNNLMTVVLAGAQLVACALPEASPEHTTLQRVSAAAKRAADLTRQLLAYAGRSRTFLERVQLAEVATQTTNLLHGSIPAHVQVRLDLDREAPSLLADLSQMHQVVDNLVNNAIEALGEREGTVLIRTGVQHVRRGEVAGLEPGSRLEPGDYVFVEVQDTGVGMSAATQRQMFDPFFTTKFTGRGLGLAAVHGIVRAHHGSIVVHSVEGRGTSVRVLLAARTGSAAANDADGGIVRGTGNVLLVDDEDLVLMTTKMVIESFGYVVHTANGVAAALEALRSTPSIATVVLDANMPGASGAASVQELRALRPTLPILICSGAGDAEIEQTFRDLGVDGFVHKPYSLPKLAEKLAQCVAAELPRLRAPGSGA